VGEGSPDEGQRAEESREVDDVPERSGLGSDHFGHDCGPILFVFVVEEPVIRRGRVEEVAERVEVGRALQD